ncbi:glycosyltransferase family 2 protein [Denitrobaculum tricleocarpae]|uniref:Glycosyltransferase family 2 protein n=1 Tax=Denitrobaculum tricleocarpae TaxID=2591009 RepID=A0A545TG96_9PROT|nr:glycosyltransferase family 2 protein [Denitrobaculum tricleocarpae]TQV76260.1 glycosyltransferase family 2 protein [Denitrobaculum tricleocarpae]
MTINKPEFSIVVPCYNEEGAIEETIDHLTSLISKDRDYEIIVVNDGSTDETGKILTDLTSKHTNLNVLTHQKNRGYGAGLKTGIGRARGDLVVITDADGTYPNERIPELVDLCQDYDMVVGARVGENVTYSKIRKIPKVFLQAWVSWIAGQHVPDINSGLRVFRRDVAQRFFRILPNSFSFTITITLAMLTTYRAVLFEPINYKARIGNSKIKPIRDTLRFCALIMRTGTYFAPMRVLMPFVWVFAALSAASLAFDTFVLQNLSDKTTLLFLATFNTAMFALLADMIDKRSAR